MSALESHTTLAVIAGGAGSRMGVPKHSLLIGGVPALVDLLERMRWGGPTLLSLGDQDASVVAGAGGFDQVIHDETPGQGPLGGVVEAIGACRTPSLVAIPVDMCGLRRDHLSWFLEHLGACEIAALRRPTGTEHAIEPFPLFLRSTARTPLERVFSGGERSVRALAGLGGFASIEAPAHWPESVWTNLNTPEDLARAERARGYTRQTHIPSP